MSNPKYDKLNSTFYQEIIFASGRTLRGYSLMHGYTEPKEKDVCLMNFILRMYRDGYLRPGVHVNGRGNRINDVSCIEYYHNKTNRKFLVCYFYSYEVVDYQLLGDWFLSAIDKLYQDIRNGMQPDFIYKKFYTSRVRSKLEWLNLDSKRFKTETDLEYFCKEVISKNLFPTGQVEGFKAKYKEKYFFNHDNLDKEQGKTSEMKKAYKEKINKLINKNKSQ